MIAVVNSGNAAQQAQWNTVFTEKADAVYILTKHQNKVIESYGRSSQVCVCCVTLKAESASDGSL